MFKYFFLLTSISFRIARSYKWKKKYKAYNKYIQNAYFRLTLCTWYVNHTCGRWDLSNGDRPANSCFFKYTLFVIYILLIMDLLSIKYPRCSIHYNLTFAVNGGGWGISFKNYELLGIYSNILNCVFYIMKHDFCQVF